VTAAGVGRPPSGVASAQGLRPAGSRPAGSRLAGVRLVRLYLASRRALTCLLVLVACAVALRTALHWIPRSGLASRQLPLTIEAGAAAVIGVTTRSPFGEPERATGRWLPFLRLGTVLALAGAAAGALAAGSASAHLAGGTLGMLRDLGGFTGIALLAAALLGGALGWVGPMAYLVVALPAVTAAWTTPWMWPARPPHDLGAALCAALVFAAGVAVTTVRGARDTARE
jgi:hypothetical protein